jgi:hypothetical protein
MTLIIMTLSIECRYDECRDYLNVMLSVVVLNVVAPFQILSRSQHMKVIVCTENLGGNL